MTTIINLCYLTHLYKDIHWLPKIIINIIKQANDKEHVIIWKTKLCYNLLWWLIVNATMPLNLNSNRFSILCFNKFPGWMRVGVSKLRDNTISQVQFRSASHLSCGTYPSTLALLSISKPPYEQHGSPALRLQEFIRHWKILMVQNNGGT